MGNVGYPITVGFAGPHIHKHGVPICEMTAILAALQRMVCRSYLATLRGRKTLSSLSQDERLSLSLYLAEVEKPPTSFYVGWFSKGILPGFSEHLATDVLSQLDGALKLYETLAIKTKPATLIGNLALAIFNDFWEITSRIGKVGNIQSLWIRILDFEPVSLNDIVLAYTESLKGKLSYLRLRNLTGVVLAPQTYARDFALVQTATHQVKIIAEEDKKLEFINSLLNILARYPDPLYQPSFTFWGRPRLRIGNDPDRFPEFVLKLGQTEKTQKPPLFSYKFPPKK